MEAGLMVARLSGKLQCVNCYMVFKSINKAMIMDVGAAFSSSLEQAVVLFLP
jgi:hypothetical protein